MAFLTTQRRQTLTYWFPGLAAGTAAWLAFIFAGHTSFIRASGLALVIAISAMTLRRCGAPLAVIGSLALAFSPAFWSQTGGRDSLDLTTTILVLLVAVMVALFMARFARIPYLGFAAGLVVFVLLFWTQLGTARSLRLTTLLAAGVLYLLVDALYITNPRPGEPQSSGLAAYHWLGLLLLFGIGVVNDALFTLLAPAIFLGLFLAKIRLPGWYWLLFALFVMVGAYGIFAEYISSTWWTYPAAQAELNNLRVPYIMADGWREGSRWVHLFELVITQFTMAGVLLGILGLARISRWYPPLGSVSMVAYASYTLFGLVYFGRNSPVLLLPLLMVQIFWMTYAAYAFGEWLQKSFSPAHQTVRWLAPAGYILLPLLMLARITGYL